MIQLNKNILQLKPSATLAINQKVQDLRREKQKVYHFGFGQSPFKIHESISKALQKNAGNNHYQPSTGLPVLKHSIASFLEKHQGLTFDESSIFIGPGSKELLYQIIYLLEGMFFIPKGSWVSYLPQIKTKDAAYKILDTQFAHNYKLSADTLEKACTDSPNVQKTLILNSPNNPTGAIYSATELKKLALVCKKYKLIVLSDEIYSQINFEADRSASMAQFYPERTLVFSGLSKVFSAGGYRLGFVAIPKSINEIYAPLKSFFSETFSAVASPVQFAALTAYEMQDELTTYIKTCTAILKEIALYVSKSLENLHIRCTSPQGAFYMLIDFEYYRSTLKLLHINNATELCIYLLNEYKIALLPGQDFYFDEKSLCCRLAFVDFAGDQVYKEYLNHNKSIDLDFIKNNTPNIYWGIQELKSFLSNLR